MKILSMIPGTRVPPSVQVSASIIILCFSIFACYANALHNGFVSDDHYVIELNQETLNIHSAIHAFVSIDRLVETNTTPYYRPLNRLSYLVDKYFFGLNPAGYHAVNISLHVLCAVLIYCMLVSLGCGSTPSLIAALLFGVHPMNAEAVNFISGRNNALATVFVLASFLAFLQAEKKRWVHGYLLSGFLFFLGLLSKETALMLLPFLLFYKTAYHVRLKNTHNAAAGRIDYIYIVFHVIFVAVYMLLRLCAIDNNYIHGHMTGLLPRVSQVVYIIPAYFTLLIAPLKLTFSYVVPVSFKGIMISLVIKWAALVAVTIYLLKKKEWVTLFGISWFVINFIPISNLILIPSNPMAERYLYLPMIGVFGILAGRLQQVSARPRTLKLTIMALVLLSLVFGILTARRNLDWKDDLSLHRSIVAADPSNPLGHYFYGLLMYVAEGDRKAAENEFHRALALDPHFIRAALANYYLGTLSVEAHDMGKAEAYFMAATKADPDNPAAHYALASMRRQQKVHDEGAGKEYRILLGKWTVANIHHIAEVNSRVLATPQNSSFRSAREHASRAAGKPMEETWKLFYRLPSGSDYYFNASGLKKNGAEVVVPTKQVLAKTDTRAFAMRLLRFPLTLATEARFVFDMNCPQKMYRLIQSEFRDSAGNLLGMIETEKEMYVDYEYIFPDTPMQKLAQAVCEKSM